MLTLAPTALGLLHGLMPLVLAPMRYVHPAPLRGYELPVTRNGCGPTS